MSKGVKAKSITFVVEQKFQFIFGNPKTQFIGCINDKDYGFGFCVVAFPKTAVFSLSAHVEDREVDFGFGKSFDLKANCGC